MTHNKATSLLYNNYEHVLKIHDMKVFQIVIFTYCTHFTVHKHSAQAKIVTDSDYVFLANRTIKIVYNHGKK